MKQRAYVKPTKGALKVGIIVAIAMFLFGLFFLSLLTEEGSQVGSVFMIFWLLVILTIAGSYAYNLVNYDKNTSSIIAEEIELPESLNSGKKEPNFDDRLHKIEKLRTEGLISEEEYSSKRKEIMKEEW